MCEIQEYFFRCKGRSRKTAEIINAKKKKITGGESFLSQRICDIRFKKKKGTNVKGGWVNEYREYSCAYLWRRALTWMERERKIRVVIAAAPNGHLLCIHI